MSTPIEPSQVDSQGVRERNVQQQALGNSTFWNKLDYARSVSSMAAIGTAQYLSPQTNAADIVAASVNGGTYTPGLGMGFSSGLNMGVTPYMGSIGFGAQGGGISGGVSMGSGYDVMGGAQQDPMQLIMLQQSINKENLYYGALTNVLKARHDRDMGINSNLR